MHISSTQFRGSKVRSQDVVRHAEHLQQVLRKRVEVPANIVSPFPNTMNHYEVEDKTNVALRNLQGWDEPGAHATIGTKVAEMEAAASDDRKTGRLLVTAGAVVAAVGIGLGLHSGELASFLLGFTGGMVVGGMGADHLSRAERADRGSATLRSWANAIHDARGQ